MDNRVYIRRCEEYDRTAIENLVCEGMAALDFRPRGKIFVKPNVVFAGPAGMLGNDACTPAAVVGASLLALARSPGVERVDLGEKSAVGIPTRMCYRFAGYYDELKRIRPLSPRPLGIFCIDEERRDPVFIGGAVHDNLRVARKMARADFKVYLPRLKCHCVSNMTGAVKLNVGICSDDERSIRHDFMLNEKIADLLAPGWPDFVIMDAIEVGVGNEAYPSLRKLGLVLMGRNPVAVDLVGARLLGYGLTDVPYLMAAVRRGYGPASLDDVKLEGDIKSVAELDEQAKRVMPYDDEFHRWQDVSKEFERLQTPMRFYWGPYREGLADKCLTGCVMGIKMWMASYERYAGPGVFASAKPVVFVIGKVDEEIDARGGTVFLLGSCARAQINNARKVVRIDKCFTTASDMSLQIGPWLGMPFPSVNPKFMLPYVGAIALAGLRKLVSLRYFQDLGHFVSKRLIRNI
ncbi:MAG TPA: DUF362 domain-containing protein [bacterium]|nr:DUF362 domain-containing protein [bacterium]